MWSTSDDDRRRTTWLLGLGLEPDSTSKTMEVLLACTWVLELGLQLVNNVANRNQLLILREDGDRAEGIDLRILKGVEAPDIGLLPQAVGPRG
jgi:hypothetical protein